MFCHMGNDKKIKSYTAKCTHIQTQTENQKVNTKPNLLKEKLPFFISFQNLSLGTTYFKCSQGCHYYMLLHFPFSWNPKAQSLLFTMLATGMHCASFTVSLKTSIWLMGHLDQNLNWGRIAQRESGFNWKHLGLKGRETGMKILVLASLKTSTSLICKIEVTDLTSK